MSDEKAVGKKEEAWGRAPFADSGLLLGPQKGDPLTKMWLVDRHIVQIKIFFFLLLSSISLSPYLPAMVVGIWF